MYICKRCFKPDVVMTWGTPQRQKELREARPRPSTFDYDIYCDACHAEVKKKLHAVHKCGCIYSDVDIVTAVFHFGFLSVEETEEHLKRLKKGEPLTIKPTKKSLSDTLHHIKPVNATASIVTGIPKESHE